MFSAIVSAPPLWLSPFFLRPLLFLVLFGIAAGAVGTLVNLRNWQFGAEASVHSIFPGIVVGAVSAVSIGSPRAEEFAQYSLLPH